MARSSITRGFIKSINKFFGPQSGINNQRSQRGPFQNSFKTEPLGVFLGVHFIRDIARYLKMNLEALFSRCHGESRGLISAIDNTLNIIHALLANIFRLFNSKQVKMVTHVGLLPVCPSSTNPKPYFKGISRMLPLHRYPLSWRHIVFLGVTQIFWAANRHLDSISLYCDLLLNVGFCLLLWSLGCLQFVFPLYILTQYTYFLLTYNFSNRSYFRS